MRLSTDYYPEYVDFECLECASTSFNVQVDSIEDDDVRVYCPVCFEPTYVRVIF